MAHVFIVDENTIKVHLNYMFAGTGAKDLSCNFLFDNSSEIKPGAERTLVGMISDISRVKPGDDILFYLQQNSQHEGLFFGSFKAVSEPFIDRDNYLEDELGKHLTFRISIRPGEVYSKGITERECLDSLKGIDHPSQMCWSLIYRKLKANRGCTMITNFEYESIMNKIRKANSEKIETHGLDYDFNECKIIPSDFIKKYNGNKDSIDIKERLLYKYNRGNAYEVHLQAYILQKFDELDPLKVNNDEISWLGNEVSCGVGMQSIDVAFIQENKNEAHFVICELKDEQPIPYIKKQIEKYVEWMKDYIVPTYTKKIVIHPTIIAPDPKPRTRELLDEIKNSTIFRSDKLEVKSIRYIGFNIEKASIKFEEV